MSTNVFPTLIGLGWSVTREPQWGGKQTGGGTIIQESVSGKETRVARRTIPRREYSLSFDILRSDSVNLELQQLEDFFNSVSGMFDSFLFNDVDDNSVTGQLLGVGDGATTSFQLVRSFGGYVERVYAPNNVTHAYLNGVDPGSWSFTSWTAPSVQGGVLTFATPPGAGVTITADFTYYWPVRFMMDSMTFSKFMQNLFECKKVGFITLI
jgi:uncharacterized protein (TIGR02217 family)